MDAGPISQCLSYFSFVFRKLYCSFEITLLFLRLNWIEGPSYLFSSLGVRRRRRHRRRLLTFTKIFSSETTKPNLTKLGHNHY